MSEPEKTTHSVAVFLRGINLGPHKRVEMGALRSALETAGYQNVRTFLASGNVLLDAVEEDLAVLKKQVEQLLEATFGFKVDTIIRSARQLGELLQADPFKNIPITPQTRLYITFLSEPPKSSLKIPYQSPEKDILIIRVSETEVCSVVELNPPRGTPEAMKIIEKEFGSKTTTRNWNTIIKMVKM
jgi:uncharacterized protein (DUF1697 family)